MDGHLINHFPLYKKAFERPLEVDSGSLHEKVFERLRFMK